MSQSTRTVDIKRADEFTNLLLDALYALGGRLMPLNLTDRPASYDKFPRALLTLVQQYSGRAAMESQEAAEAAFQEWQSWTLRKLDRKNAYQAQKEYPQLQRLQQWMRQNADFFTPAALRHLRKSFYGRTYAYLYPRLALIMDFKDYCHEQDIGLDEIPRTETALEIDTAEITQRKTWVRAVADETFVREHFERGTGRSRIEITQTMGETYVEQFQEEAISFLLQHPHYFNTIFSKN